MKMAKEYENKESCLADLVDMQEPNQVMSEVKNIISLENPEFDFTSLDKVFNDITMLFNGEFSGYKKCNTFYHDLKHTTDTFLAMARLMHGYIAQGAKVSEKNINLGLINALMHDTGYIQKSDDNLGTGAKYTQEHVVRSIDFMKDYFKQNGYSEDDIKFGEDCIICTDLKKDINEIDFSSHEEEVLSKMLGSADLMGQMADSTYLEKLTYLYDEFKEAKIPDYKDEFDFATKSIGFYDFVKNKLENNLGDQKKYLANHFRKRWGIDKDMYSDAIEKNIKHLEYILDKSGESYRDNLKRKL